MLCVTLNEMFELAWQAECKLYVLKHSYASEAYLIAYRIKPIDNIGI
jgi:hypothetical protein